MTERKFSVFSFSGVVVREREMQVLRDGQVLTVEPRAFRTLLYLLRKPKQLLSKEEIQNAVWGETAVSTTHRVSTAFLYPATRQSALSI